jgi:triosephosphate isomerase (TIM)
VKKLNANKLPQKVGQYTKTHLHTQAQHHNKTSAIQCQANVAFLICTVSVSSSMSDAVVAPTFLHLDYVLRTLDKSYKVSAQNAAVTGTGAYTGEVAATQLKDFGINWVILGHSERRQLFHTTDDIVAKQTTIALKSGLSVIACVGETLEERKGNKTWSVIERQLNAISQAVKGGEEWDRIVIAYEPVWAIGTGETATPQQAQDVHKQIRDWAERKIGKDVAGKVRIIYGGSVKGSNADELFAQKDIDGFLVGGASLQAEEWQKIVTAPTRIKSKL